MSSETIDNKPISKNVGEEHSTVSKDERKHFSLGSIIYDYFSNASAHGLFGIARSENVYNRIYWTISFLFFTALMSYFVITAIRDYFTYPTNMNVDVVNEWPQYFPAFSICNAAPMRMDRFIEPFLNYTNALNLTNTNDTTTLSPVQAGYIWNFFVDSINSNYSLEAFFYSFQSMVVSCYYNGKPCTAADFIPFTSSLYGLCYTFNAKLKTSNGSHVRYGNENGGNGQLDLSLYVYSNLYVPYVSDGIGVVVLVHDNTKIPLIEQTGLYLAPGRKHKLGYKKETIFFLSSPYTDCTDKISLQMQAMLKNYNDADYGYDEVVCYELCEQVYVYEQCGCVDPGLWNARSIVLPGTNEVIVAPLCYTNNSCYKSAQNELLSSIPLLTKYCADCSGECSTTSFHVDSSSLITPLEWQMAGIKTFVENSFLPLPANWSTNWREQIRTDYLQVSVVCETTTVVNYTQRAAIKLVDVLSNIGGQTSLWIGVSFLSLMELVEMVYRLILYQVRALARRRRQIMPQ